MIEFVAARRAFNDDFIALQTWLDAQDNAAPIEVWERFSAQLGASFGAQNAALWNCALHPQWRAPLARLFCRVAVARMQLDPWADPLADNTEARLWSAALAASPRAVREWEAQTLKIQGEIGAGFVSAKHRLADLYRRAGRCDQSAVRLYVEIFTGRNALPEMRRGAGAHHAVGALLERGASISAHTDAAQIAARYGLCLLLWNRRYGAAWVGRSLQLARAQLPATRARLDEISGIADARRLRAAQQPAIANLAATLAIVAREREWQEWESQQAEIERQKAAATKPKRKRGRPRKVAPETVEIAPITPQPNASPTQAIAQEDEQWDVDWNAIDFNRLFKEEPPAPAKKKANPEVVEWDEFDFDFEEKNNS